MSPWELAGWVAFALNVWGNLALTNKSTHGWVIRLASNVFWIAYSYDTSAWALLANHVAFGGINVVGWIRWSRECAPSATKKLKNDISDIQTQAQQGHYESKRILALMDMVRSCDGDPRIDQRNIG